MEYKQLYRSRSNKVIAGVCGGIGEYFNIDPVIIRVIALVVPGFNLLAYLVMALLIPTEQEY